MTRLYCDEDSMRHALIVALRKRGVDVTTALEAGMTEEPDEVQLAYAARLKERSIRPTSATSVTSTVSGEPTENRMQELSWFGSSNFRLVSKSAA